MNQSSWQRIWAHRGLMACLLWPISWVYGTLWSLRLTLYRWGWFGSTQLPIPVLVVGNVMLGGVGKTPVVIALVQQLGRLGWRVGVISRGHGRQRSDVALLDAHSRAAEVGDEPLLIYRRTGVPVAVGNDRSQAACRLLNQFPELNLIISDDGMQHTALAHDLALCLFDHRRIGNGWLLPAGPLREPWPLREDQRAPTWFLSSEQPPWLEAWPIRRSLSELAHNGHGVTFPWRQWSGPVGALAAIAQPEVFFQSLRDGGLTPMVTEARSDHDPWGDWSPNPDLSWVCTEKDAVKIWERHPQVWAIPLQVDLPERLVDEVSQFLQARLSSPHGSKTL